MATVIRSALLVTALLQLSAMKVRATESTDIQTVAEQAGVDLVDLEGAVNTTGYSATEYLCLVGEGPCPKPVRTVWDRLADCESNGNWAINAYHDGGLQFHPTTWTNYKPKGYPAYAWQASREQQIAVAERVQAVEGWKAWPVCSRRLGLR